MPRSPQPHSAQRSIETLSPEFTEPEWLPPPADPIRGRGAAENPAGRFERLRYDPEPAVAASGAEQLPPVRTIYLRDPTRTALAHNQSPDINFSASLNPYRGCEHGCVYCYARPTHEYLGFSAGLDFESRILVKEDAPVLLRRELAAKRWKPQVVGLSGVTDPYQPIERRLEITRRCLRVFADFRNPVQMITKNGLVARDADLLAELAEHDAASVAVSVTTLDADLHHIMEPRTSHPSQRLKAIESLARAGVPVGVMVAPIIPAINDHEIPAILQAAADAGASYAGHVMLRLPHGVKDLFSAWLERHYPDRRDKVLSKLRAVRGGRLNDPAFGSRMKGSGVYADQIHDLFRLWRQKVGIAAEGPNLSTAAFRKPGDAQLHLF
jgi:DNA repair photolyase